MSKKWFIFVGTVGLLGWLFLVTFAKPTHVSGFMATNQPAPVRAPAPSYMAAQTTAVSPTTVVPQPNPMPQPAPRPATHITSNPIPITGPSSQGSSLFILVIILLLLGMMLGMYQRGWKNGRGTTLWRHPNPSTTKVGTFCP